MTMVGYGDLVPTTATAKVFVMVYTLFSLTIVASAVQTTFTALLERQEKYIQDFLGQPALLSAGRGAAGCHFAGVSPRTNSQSVTTELRGSPTPSWWMNTRRLLPEKIHKLATAAGVFLLLTGAGTALYAWAESISTLDSPYMIWITCTTVGFGDVTPRTDVSKLFSVAFLVCVTFSLANLLGTGTDVLLARRHREWQAEILNRKVDMSDLVSMDTDGDGRISKLESLVAMLRRLESVHGEEIDDIIARFDELDRDGSGYVEVSELEM